MSTKRTFASAALGFCVAFAVVAVPATAQASPAGPALPQVSSAQHGATWLAGQLTPEGYIPSAFGPGADLSATANTILALASAGVDPSGASNALAYMASNVDAYVSQDGADGPGQLATLILDAHALGASPTSFGGTDLVSRLLATEQTSGADTGLFGTEDQANDFLAGAFDQGLALAALAAVGLRSGTAIGRAETWLHGQQCSDGGWTSYEPMTPCSGSPADFEGPDTNSTALAVEGLSAEGDLGSKDAGKALKFITHAQDSDGGWGYEPNAAAAPGSTDPDSTALVIQGILALGKSPTQAAFDHHSANPVSVLESFQLTSGSDAGAFTFPGISGANTLATYQAVPALAGVVFPFSLAITTASLPLGTLHHTYTASLSAVGGNAPYKWTVLKGSGTLPTGLKLKKSTGVITGRPRSATTSTFVVEVTDTKTSSQPRTQNIAWKVFSLTT
jgi:hypothetical protein